MCWKRLLVVFHHGVLNPHPSMLRYPRRMNLIQMITLYQMWSSMQSVPPLKYISTNQVSHIDKDGECISRMRIVMKVVRHFTELGMSWNQELLQTTGIVKQLLCCGMVFLRILCLICWLKLRWAMVSPSLFTRAKMPLWRGELAMTNCTIKVSLSILESRQLCRCFLN